MKTQHVTESSSPIEVPPASPENGQGMESNGRFDGNTIFLWVFVTAILLGGVVAAYELWARITGHPAL